MLLDLSIRTPYKYKIEFREGGAIWSITSLYLKCLKKYNSKNIKKVIVEIIDEPVKDNIEYMLDVIKVSKSFEFSKYFEAKEKYTKKKLLLDVLQDGLLIVANHEKWLIKPLLDAYNCCLDKNLEHKWLRKDKYFLSPNRKYYAGIFCNWDIDKFEVFVIFLNKQKEEVDRVKLFESIPWDVDPLGRMGWDKKTSEFYLYSKDEKRKWIARLNEK